MISLIFLLLAVQMKYSVLCMILTALHAARAGNLIQVQPAVVQYGVVPQRTAIYSSPSVHVSAPLVHGHLNAPIIPSYAVHSAPAVSHHYSHTQTHPVAYVRPVSFDHF